MKCPLCNVEARILANQLVERKDGTFAYRMQYTCRNKQCDNNGKIFRTEYNPIEPIKE